MVFTVDIKLFLTESYFRNGTKIGGVGVYSMQNCIEKFQAEFPNSGVDYIQFKKTLDRAVNLFHRTGSILRKPSSGAVQKRTDEIVINAQDNGKCTKNICPTIESPN
jgi:hypothetical protein